MGEVTTVGLDIAKSVFQVHGIDAERPSVRPLEHVRPDPHPRRRAPARLAGRPRRPGSPRDEQRGRPAHAAHGGERVRRRAGARPASRLSGGEAADGCSRPRSAPMVASSSSHLRPPLARPRGMSGLTEAVWKPRQGFRIALEITSERPLVRRKARNRWSGGARLSTAGAGRSSHTASTQSCLSECLLYGLVKRLAPSALARGKRRTDLLRRCSLRRTIDTRHHRGAQSRRRAWRWCLEGHGATERLRPSHEPAPPQYECRSPLATRRSADRCRRRTRWREGVRRPD